MGNAFRHRQTLLALAALVAVALIAGCRSDVTVSVVDELGSPVEAADLAVSRGGHEDATLTKTGDGTFKGALAYGTYTAVATAPGYETTTQPLDAQSREVSETIKLRRATVVPPPETYSLRVVVTDAGNSSAGIRGATVTVRPSDGSASEHSVTKVGDGYIVEPLYERTYTVTAQAAGYDKAERKDVAVPPDSSVSLALSRRVVQPTHPLKIQVFGMDTQQPILNATVTLTAAGPSGNEYRARLNAGGLLADRSYEARLPAGEYDVAVTAPGYSKYSEPLTAPSTGEKPWRADLVAIGNDRHPIAVRVTDTAGAALSPATVVAQLVRGGTRHILPRVEGAYGPFRHEIPEGPYRVTVSATGYVTRIVQITVPQSDAELVSLTREFEPPPSPPSPPRAVLRVTHPDRKLVTRGTEVSLQGVVENAWDGAQVRVSTSAGQLVTSGGKTLAPTRSEEWVLPVRDGAFSTTARFRDEGRIDVSFVLVRADGTRSTEQIEITVDRTKPVVQLDGKDIVDEVVTEAASVSITATDARTGVVLLRLAGRDLPNDRSLKASLKVGANRIVARDGAGNSTDITVERRLVEPQPVDRQRDDDIVPPRDTTPPTIAYGGRTYADGSEIEVEVLATLEPAKLHVEDESAVTVLVDGTNATLAAGNVTSVALSDILSTGLTVVAEDASGNRTTVTLRRPEDISGPTVKFGAAAYRHESRILIPPRLTRQARSIDVVFEFVDASPLASVTFNGREATIRDDQTVAIPFRSLPAGETELRATDIWTHETVVTVVYESRIEVIASELDGLLRKRPFEPADLIAIRETSSQMPVKNAFRYYYDSRLAVLEALALMDNPIDNAAAIEALFEQSAIASIDLAAHDMRGDTEEEHWVPRMQFHAAMVRYEYIKYLGARGGAATTKRTQHVRRAIQILEQEFIPLAGIPYITKELAWELRKAVEIAPSLTAPGLKLRQSATDRLKELADATEQP